MPIIRTSTWVLAVASAVSLSACFVGRDDPSRFYTLTAVAAAPATGTSPLGVGLGPVSMPGYLRRPTLAIRVDTNQVRYEEFARWAEPLASQFQRTLARDLEILLASDRVVQFPWAGDTPVTVAVRVDVHAFEVDTSNTARLDATWTIRDPRTGAIRHGDESTIAEPSPPGNRDGADAAVAGLSRAVARLAEQIAAALPRR